MRICFLRTVPAESSIFCEVYHYAEKSRLLESKKIRDNHVFSEIIMRDALRPDRVKISVGYLFVRRRRAERRGSTHPYLCM